MIAKEPDSLEKFPVPVTGQEIPRGWFSRLVAFINSLVLRGDNQFFCVSRSNAGTTISPTKKMIDLLNDRGGSAPSSGTVTITGMVYPDWTANPFSGFYLNSAVSVTDGDAWIYFNGNWTATGAGTSYLHLVFSIPGGGTKSYQVAAFTSLSSGEQGFFEKFLPIKKGSTFTLADTTAGNHSITLSNAWLFNYPTS